jgi:hypothetical protein
MAQLMSQRINSRLSHLSLLLFHDQRPEGSDSRNDEIAQTALSLADCFAVVGALERGPAATGSDFESYLTMERFNAHSLSDAAYQRDHNSQIHWFVHIKEVCQACHSQYRFETRAAAPERP